MNLLEAQDRAWTQPADQPKTQAEALGRLERAIERAMEAYHAHRLVHTQMELEELLALTLIAMKTFGLDPDRGLERAIARRVNRMGQTSEEKQVFCFFPDRVEIRVAGQLRGGWSLFSEEDIEAAKRLASELGCEILEDREAVRQLDLFGFQSPPPPRRS